MKCEIIIKFQKTIIVFENKNHKRENERDGKLKDSGVCVCVCV